MIPQNWVNMLSCLQWIYWPRKGNCLVGLVNFRFDTVGDERGLDLTEASTYCVGLGKTIIDD